MDDISLKNGNSVNIPLPGELPRDTIQQSEVWPKWRRRFERYCYASGLSNKSDAEKVSTLLYAMGDVSDDILVTLDIQWPPKVYDNP